MLEDIQTKHHQETKIDLALINARIDELRVTPPSLDYIEARLDHMQDVLLKQVSLCTSRAQLKTTRKSCKRANTAPRMYARRRIPSIRPPSRHATNPAPKEVTLVKIVAHAVLIKERGGHLQSETLVMPDEQYESATYDEKRSMVNQLLQLRLLVWLLRLDRMQLATRILSCESSSFDLIHGTSVIHRQKCGIFERINSREIVSLKGPRIYDEHLIRESSNLRHDYWRADEFDLSEKDIIAYFSVRLESCADLDRLLEEYPVLFDNHILWWCRHFKAYKVCYFAPIECPAPGMFVPGKAGLSPDRCIFTRIRPPRISRWIDNPVAVSPLCRMAYQWGHDLQEPRDELVYRADLSCAGFSCFDLLTCTSILDDMRSPRPGKWVCRVEQRIPEYVTVFWKAATMQDANGLQWRIKRECFIPPRFTAIPF